MALSDTAKTLDDVRAAIYEVNIARDIASCAFMELPPVRLPQSYRGLETYTEREDWIADNRAVYGAKFAAHLDKWASLSSFLASHRKHTAKEASERFTIDLSDAPASGLSPMLSVALPRLANIKGNYKNVGAGLSDDATADFGF